MNKRWIMVDKNAYDNAVEKVIEDLEKMTGDLSEDRTRDAIMHMNILVMAMLRRILFEE